MHFQLNPSVSPFLPMNNNADKANASEVLNSNSGYVNSNSKSKIINYANSNSFHINTLLRRIPPPCKSGKTEFAENYDSTNGKKEAMFDIYTDLSMHTPHTSVCYANANVKVNDVNRDSREGYGVCNREHFITQAPLKNHTPISVDNSNNVINKANCFWSFDHAHNVNYCGFSETRNVSLDTASKLKSTKMPINVVPSDSSSCSDVLNNINISNDTMNYMHNLTPHVLDIDTPACSDTSNVTDKTTDIPENKESAPANNPLMILEGIRKKYVKNVVIGHLNINALANKIDALKIVIKDKVDILVLVETKLNDSFPIYQFVIEGYTTPYRLDRNCYGGGVMIYVRKDIHSKELKKHNLPKNIEALFIEINLRKTKLLLVGTYHSKHAVHGTSDTEFFEQIGLALDIYSGYDKFLIAGDFNVQVGEPSIDEFLDDFGAKNLVNDLTCFKSTDNPSCIDLFLTNSGNSFQNTQTVNTGLSDFHVMIVTVLKTTFPKVKPKTLVYRDYSKFIQQDFRAELRAKIQVSNVGSYVSFEDIFLMVLNKHAPLKKKKIRANHKPYVTKQLRKAIMRRSYLENKFHKDRSIEKLFIPI